MNFQDEVYYAAALVAAQEAVSYKGTVLSTSATNSKRYNNSYILRTVTEVQRVPRELLRELYKEHDDFIQITNGVLVMFGLGVCNMADNGVYSLLPIGSNSDTSCIRVSRGKTGIEEVTEYSIRGYKNSLFIYKIEGYLFLKREHEDSLANIYRQLVVNSPSYKLRSYKLFNQICTSERMFYLTYIHLMATGVFEFDGAKYGLPVMFCVPTSNFSISVGCRQSFIKELRSITCEQSMHNYLLEVLCYSIMKDYCEELDSDEDYAKSLFGKTALIWQTVTPINVGSCYTCEYKEYKTDISSVVIYKVTEIKALLIVVKTDNDVFWVLTSRDSDYNYIKKLVRDKDLVDKALHYLLGVKLI